MTLREAQARQHLQELLNKYHALSDSERKGRSEADVVAQFIVPLLRDVLGWPTEDPARYRYEMVTEVGRPDMVLTPAQGGVVFVEAKRFGVIKELEQARRQIEGVIRPAQMGLPGLAVDRTPEEQQAINYAFANGGTWAILTNFEKLRLFNARRDWLVLSFETPSAFLLEFDQLWQLAYENVVQGSLEPLSNQRFARDIDSAYLDFINEWRLRLARDIARRRKQNPWAFNADGSIRLHDLRAVVQRYLDRLVIARFAEDWLVIPPGTLRDYQELRQRNRYSFSLDEFLDQFFRRFDEDHNSALFARGLVDEANFSDEALLPLLEKLYEVRYRAMPADILGNTYEQFLGKALALKDGDIDARDNLETRKKQGSYYTPQVIVQYIVDHSLGRYLYGTENGQADGKPLPGETRKTSQDIRDLRVLDSACGSGSFLIYAYRVLADFYAGEIKRLEAEGEARRRELTAQGITSPLELQIQLTPYTAEIERIRDYHYLILERHLYGLDLDPQAAEIATVNLIMRAMEGRHQHKLLPLILNQNVKVGNALVGWRAEDERLNGQRPALAELVRLREQVIRELSGTEHDRAQTELEARTAALRAELDEPLRAAFSDLERVRPFHWGIEFPEVFCNADGTAKAEPGFTIIFGNPPWEILKPDLREFYAQFDERIESKYSRAQAEERIAELDAEEPRRRADFEALNASVGQTTAFLRGSADYRRQGRGDPATHKLFLERMYGLLRPDGRLGYVIPSGIYTDLGTKDLREMLLNEGSIEHIFSFSNERFFFPSVHHSFKFCLLGARRGTPGEGFWATFRFNPRVAVAPENLHGFLANPENLVYIRRESLARFSPDSLSVMEFQTRRDYAIVEKMYDTNPLLGENSEIWNVDFAQDFHITNDRDLFNTTNLGLPLFEGKMIQQFDSGHAAPQFWVEESVGKIRLGKARYAEWYTNYRFAFREIARSTDSRTAISAMLPPQSFATITLWTGTTGRYSTDLYLVGVFNSFCFDYLTRFRVGTHMTLFLTKQLPLPRLTAGNRYFDAIVPRAARLTCTRAAFAGLWEAVMGKAWEDPHPLTPSERNPHPLTPSPLHGEGESEGPAVEAGERLRLRDEIDGLVAHLYGLSREDYGHILSSFPLVFPETAAGQARRAAALAAYDAMGGSPHPLAPSP